MKKIVFPLSLSLVAMLSQAQTSSQTAASVSYTPTWQARHHLQWLADNADLPLMVSHWPLPAAAVQQALDKLVLSGNSEAAMASRDFVRKELESVQSKGRIQLHLRSESEGMGGYGEAYTPGSSGQISTAEARWAGNEWSAAGRLGARLEANSNSMPAESLGLPHEGRYKFRPQGSEAVLAWGGWNLQAFSRQNWWGPGWQSSLINGHNSPAWLGAGLQRGTVAPSESAWLSWMGPWNLDVFAAKAQDPVVVSGQPAGYIYSGVRLTMKPKTWLEVGLSRGLQTGGAGRPSGAGEFVKAFLGQDTNKDPDSPFQDSSNQVAGYDVRARCPENWGSCAVYTQWIGEDSAGKFPPLPYRFMKMYGAEKTYAEGRYRVFAEYANTYTTAPFNLPGLIAGYTNGVYSQGYTNGARWVGSPQGGAAEVTTLGWMDAASMRAVKLHVGRIGLGLGAYAPLLNAPHGRMWGFSATQTVRWMGMTLTPELAYTHLAEGDDQGAGKRNNLRLGLMMAVPF